MRPLRDCFNLRHYSPKRRRPFMPPGVLLLPFSLSTCNESEINANSVGRAIRNKHYIHAAVFLTRARHSGRGANLHP